MVSAEAALCCCGSAKSGSWGVVTPLAFGPVKLLGRLAAAMSKASAQKRQRPCPSAGFTNSPAPTGHASKQQGGNMDSRNTGHLCLWIAVSITILINSGFAHGANVNHRPLVKAPHHYKSAWLQARQNYMVCMSGLGTALTNCSGDYTSATHTPLQANTKAEAEALNTKLSTDCINEAISAGDVHACSKIDDENSDAISDRFLGSMRTDTGSGRVQRQTAEQVRQHYFIVASSGTPMDVCVQAGIVAAAYLQANDQDNYSLWVQTREDDCNRAGRSR